MSAADTGPLQVRQTVTDDTYGTRLTPLPADVLPRIARALVEAGVMDEFLILGRNTNPDGIRRGIAMHSILGAARDARIDWDAVLGIDLTPDEATALACQVEDTAQAPATCSGEGGRCTRWAEPDLEHCLECQARLADPWMQGVA